MKKILIALLLCVMGMIVIGQQTTPIHAQEQSDWWYDLGQFRESTYYRTLNTWSSTYQKSTIDAFLVPAQNQQIDNPNIAIEDGVALIPRNESFLFTLEAPSSGLYHLKWLFHIDETFSQAPNVSIHVNGELPFNELARYALPVEWALEPRDETERFNRFGNELLPHTVAITEAYEAYMRDPHGRFTEPYWIALEEGSNTIEIRALNQTIGIEGVAISGGLSMNNYQNYRASHVNQPEIRGVLTVQGQDMTSKNDIEIKAGYHKGPNMSPTEHRYNVLNMLSGNSMMRGGMAASYDIDVEQAGLYMISLKYMQNQMIGLSSARRILINGEVPFEEFNHYLFPYERQWTLHTLGEDQGGYLVYLNAGTNTITFEATTSHIMPIIDDLHHLMDEINSLGMAIRQITGNSDDVFIDWDLLRYMPEISETLNAHASKLEAIYNEINEMTPSSRRAAEVSTLNIASQQLRRLAGTPNRIPSKMAELNEGSGSSYQLIGIAVNSLMQQPLHMDEFYLHHQDASLPRAHPNLWQRMVFSVKSFVHSFFDQRYRVTANPDDDVLEVWIGQSTLYLDLIQNMIDDDFTRQTGINVKVSVLPNTQRIILNNATNTNPDVVLSIDSWEPYAYALRGMLADLGQFEGFSEMASQVHPNNFTPMIYSDGVYGMPETQGLYLLYYRKDILGFLDLAPPDTWDDVLNMLPVLQSYHMNFFHPLGGETAYKGFGLTAPFIYQFGGEIYSESGLTTTFHEDINIQAITFMTDIFNVYNLPQQVPSFFEHFRSGSLPVGVGPVDMYLQVKYAAPELNGQWGILPIPGMVNQDTGEVERWAPSYGKASILFERSNMKEEGFQLIEWWNKTETQITLLESVKMTLGERYLFIPANLAALEQSIWDDELIEQSLLQAAWSRIPAVTPGSYIVERELTNIWNKVVIDKINPRVAIDQSIPRINRELARKFEEFGYVERGEIVREYIVPRNDNIHQWIK